MGYIRHRALAHKWSVPMCLVGLLVLQVLQVCWLLVCWSGVWGLLVWGLGLFFQGTTGSPSSAASMTTFASIFQPFFDPLFCRFLVPKQTPRGPQKSTNPEKVTVGALSGPLCERVLEKDQILESPGTPK